jgi:endoglucanase
MPNWRGFNLLERFSIDWSGHEPFRESDFEMIREWGFNYVRLPLDYRYWGNQKDLTEIRGDALVAVDKAVELGRQYGVHVCINFHRAPGYCVNQPVEPTNLFTDEGSMRACALHWRHFAERYKGRPGSEVSFNLLNEPRPEVGEEQYDRFVRLMTGAIREVDAGRPIVVDGVNWCARPAWSVWDVGVIQSGRGYGPFGLTHYKAGWIEGSEKWSVPSWPGDGWDVERLDREVITPWREYQERGGSMFVGEFGCFNHTPHAVAIAWMRDLVGLYRRQGWGYALWNLRGAFGVLDSGRGDAEYENFRGMKLDRKMLEVLRGG